MKRVLLACEFSGVVRSAFERYGWDATSCDLLPSERPGKHIQGDVLNILNEGWDLIIAFPPCTYLTYAGSCNWDSPFRVKERIKAADFFMQMYNAPAAHVCVENPRGVMTHIFRKPDQEIHPYFFGDREMKRTCLWLKNLPKLHYSLEADLFTERPSAAPKPEPKDVQRCKKTGRLKNRYWCDIKIRGGKERSIFFPSVAEAMAKQWTEYIKNK